MWPKFYRDYQLDRPLVKYQVEPSHGIIGCEMHDLNGWGNSLHIPSGRHRRRPGYRFNPALDAPLADRH